MKSFSILLLLLFPSLALAMGEDDPVITKVMIDQLEVRNTEGSNTTAWDASIYAGKDINKFWVKTEGEISAGETEAGEARFLFSHAIAPYWDFMAGIKRDFQPTPERNWLELGVQGLAPYFIETEVSLFLGEHQRTGLRIEIEREFMLSQRWVLSQDLEMNFHGHNDEATGTGSGLSSLEFGLRLHYEIKREIAPYIGINYEKLFGNTAGYARNEGEDTSDTQIVLGIKVWF